MQNPATIVLTESTRYASLEFLCTDNVYLENIECYQVTSEELSPVICKDDEIIIDTNQKEIVCDRFYAIQSGDELKLHKAKVGESSLNIYGRAIYKSGWTD